MTTSLAKKERTEPQGIIPFVTEVARYFMDFLETDFHKVRNPKRFIQTRNSSNLQVCISLNKYKKYTPLLWKVIRNGFADDSLKELKRGAHTNKIPPSLSKLIQQQIALIESELLDGIVVHFKNEIELGLSKNPNDTTAALTFALEGISRTIRNNFLAAFIENIREPLVRMRTETVDSVFQIEEELTEVLMRPFEDVVSSIINRLALRQKVDAEQLLAQVFDLRDVKSKLEIFFKGFSVGDLFLEVSELVNNKNLLERQELYLYFCDITYKNHTYHLFYVPVQIEKTPENFSFAFDSLLYVNKKAIQFISQEYNEALERKGTLHAFFNRIIYLTEEREHLIGKVDLALKEAANYFGLNPYLDVANPSYQAAKGQGIQITNSCYLGLFDKSDESLVNDYEEILLKLKEGGGDLASAFQLIIDNFITNNPIPVVSEVDGDWDSADSPDKLVYASPVPLNEEQRQILTAIGKSKCKYVTVEGPPGTGKSHTITAIVCDAILKNQSVLVLSDKKEALDVVEDKITETMNKVRLDEQFQNPLLRLGRAGSTYSKILSATSMDNIKGHYRAVKNTYGTLESNITDSVSGLKSKIENSIAAYEKISLKDVAEFISLEAEILAAKDLPASLEELHADALAVNIIASLRKEMLELSNNCIITTAHWMIYLKNFTPTARVQIISVSLLHFSQYLTRCASMLVTTFRVFQKFAQSL